MTRYRTIVADPPWPQSAGGMRTRARGKPWSLNGRPGSLPYSTMSVSEIAALPVAGLAGAEAHLYLWTTNAFLEEAFGVLRAWGFRRSQVLVWTKSPMGLGPGGAYASTAEFVLFARLGSLRPLRRWDSTWFHAKRPTIRHARNVSPAHSAKPPEFLDMVEAVSPGPYVELFSRTTEPRFGWDYWGDQSLGTAQMPGAAA